MTRTRTTLENCPFPLGDPHPRLIHGSFGPPESSSKTVSRSVQPFIAQVTVVCPNFTMGRYITGTVCVCVCVCVCLSVCEDISRTTRAIFTNFCACCLSPWLSPPPARVTQSQRKGAIFGIFFPLTMDCTAEHLGFIQKRLNRSRIKMPFEMMTHVGHRYHVLDGNPIPEGTGQFLGSFNRQ